MAKAKQPGYLWFLPDPWDRWKVQRQKSRCKKNVQAGGIRKKTNHKTMPKNTFGRLGGRFPPLFKKMRSNTAQRAVRLFPSWTVLSGSCSFRKWSTAGLEVQVVMACCHLGFSCVGRTPERGAFPKSALTKFPDSSRGVVFQALYKLVAPQHNTGID